MHVTNKSGDQTVDMKANTPAIVLALLACVCVLGFSSAVKKDGVPTYTINLDLDPSLRWKEVISDYKWEIPELYKILKTFVPAEFLPVVDLLGNSLDTYIPQPYADELRGIALGAAMPLGDVALLNILYDVTAFCTSIVVEDEKGVIYHGRNLDYHFTDILRNITLVAHFQRGGKTVYTSTTYAGYVGVLTGQKPYGFSVSVDERDQGAWWENLLEAILDHNASFISFLVRDTLEEAGDFESAVKTLAYTPLIAPVYFIIGGVGPREGAVITRDRVVALNVWHLDAENGRWFLVETNYDHWTTPPTHDDRRDPAIKSLEALGRKNFTSQGLFGVLSTPPVLNDGTIYTTIMSASQPDLYMTWIRYNKK